MLNPNHTLVSDYLSLQQRSSPCPCARCGTLTHPPPSRQNPVTEPCGSVCLSPNSSSPSTLPATANERTFLSWCSMATTMGGVSSAMVGLSISAAGSSEGRLISRKTVDLVSAVYVPVAIIMILYALFTYEWRSRFMHKKQVSTWGCRCRRAQLG